MVVAVANKNLQIVGIVFDQSWERKVQTSKDYFRKTFDVALRIEPSVDKNQDLTVESFPFDFVSIDLMLLAFEAFDEKLDVS